MLQGQVSAAAELHAGSARELLRHQKELKHYAARLVFTPFIPQILPRGHLFQIFAQNRNFSSVQKSRRARNFLRVKVVPSVFSQGTRQSSDSVWCWDCCSHTSAYLALLLRKDKKKVSLQTLDCLVSLGAFGEEHCWIPIRNLGRHQLSVSLTDPFKGLQQFYKTQHFPLTS